MNDISAGRIFVWDWSPNFNAQHVRKEKSDNIVYDNVIAIYSSQNSYEDYNSNVESFILMFSFGSRLGHHYCYLWTVKKSYYEKLIKNYSLINLLFYA